VGTGNGTSEIGIARGFSGPQRDRAAGLLVSGAGRTLSMWRQRDLATLQIAVGGLLRGLPIAVIIGA
jgi:hypothetical protein